MCFPKCKGRMSLEMLRQRAGSGCRESKADIYGVNPSYVLVGSTESVFLGT